MSEFTDALDNVLRQRLRDVRQQEVVVNAIMTGFERVQKKPVPDLPERLQRLEERVKELAKHIEVRFLNGRLVVKTDGPSEALMTEFRRGSDWYVGWDEVDETVLAATLTDPSK